MSGIRGIMENAVKVFLGWDSRETVAYDVAAFSLLRRSSIPVAITPLRLSSLQQSKLLTRQTELREGKMWDVISEAPQSTEFAISRFLTPLLGQSGWALFADCDVLFLDDVRKLFALADPQYAVMCVKHEHIPTEHTKMDGQLQTTYARKNWSSVMLFNCDHPANAKLDLTMINELPGRDLHRFCWLDDSHIGALPSQWNWLVGVSKAADDIALAHYTLGGPWFPSWKGGPLDNLWLDERAALKASAMEVYPRERATSAQNS